PVQPFAHTRLLQTTLESRQSITPPVESHTGPLLWPTTCPRLARDKRSTPNRRIHGDFLELDFWPACAEPRRREARFFQSDYFRVAAETAQCVNASGNIAGVRNRLRLAGHVALKRRTPLHFGSGVRGCGGRI